MDWVLTRLAEVEEGDDTEVLDGIWWIWPAGEEVYGEDLEHDGGIDWPALVRFGVKLLVAFEDVGKEWDIMAIRSFPGICKTQVGVLHCHGM
jgi:hypothetical protein